MKSEENLIKFIFVSASLSFMSHQYLNKKENIKSIESFSVSLNSANNERLNKKQTVKNYQIPLRFRQVSFKISFKGKIR